jgi:DNA-binding beta-propeller fold protein YncE
MKSLLIALVTLSATLSADLPTSATMVDLRAAGSLSGANGVMVDSTGRIFISDPTQGFVKAFDGGVQVERLNGVAGSTIPVMAGIDTDSAGHIYVAQKNPCQIVVYASDGTVLRTFGNKPADISNFNVATSPWVDQPSDLSVAPDGRVYVADTGHNRIAVYDANTGAFLMAWGHTGYVATDELYLPYGVTEDHGLIYVADAGNARVMVYDTTGHFVKQIGSRGIGPAGLDSPFAVTLDGSGNIWVADNGLQKLVVYAANGDLLKVYGAGGGDGLSFQDPVSLYTSPDGTVSLADGASSDVYIFSTGVSYSRGTAEPKAGPQVKLSDALLAFGPVPARAGQPLRLQLPFNADRVHWDILSLDMRRVGGGEEQHSELVASDTQGLDSGIYIIRTKVEVGGESRQEFQKIIVTR